MNSNVNIWNIQYLIQTTSISESREFKFQYFLEFDSDMVKIIEIYRSTIAWNGTAIYKIQNKL